MAKTPVKKKRAPQDLTLRNIRAANKRLADLERRVTALEYAFNADAGQGTPTNET